MPADRKLQIRCDDEFLEVLDDWRARRRPILSRSAALRHMVFRGAMAENHLAEIFRLSAERLAAANLIGVGAPEGNYKRFQKMVIQILDELASEEKASAFHSSPLTNAMASHGHEARETPDPDTGEQDTPPDFRRALAQKS
ncbi:MAG: hypothetical protein AAGA09_06020 [Pseudomonadota bacterium]